jgi:hypothetical protein
LTVPDAHGSLAAMLPLAGKQFPESARALADALQARLAARGFAPARVTVEAPQWPAIAALKLDLTGARITRNVRLPESVMTGTARLRCERFEIVAAPLYFEGTPARLHLRAEAVVFACAGSAEEEPMLVLDSAAHGTVEIEIAKPDLEAMLQRVAVLVAGDHGVTVKKTAIELTAHHSRMLAVRAEVTAKMFVVSAAVKLAGEVAVDDALRARLSNLRVSADGMVGAMVNSVAHPFLEKWEGREFTLLAFSLGAVKLRDVAVQGGDSLRLEAHFGAA